MHEGRAAIVVATRLSLGVDPTLDAPLVNMTNWKDTAIVPPRSLVDRRLVHVLDDEGDDMSTTRIPLARVFARLPVALMELR